MAKKVLEIKDFSRGLNCFSDARDIEPNQFAQLWNVNSSQVGILKQGGSLVQSLYGLPHDNANIQVGYGLFATGIDNSISSIEGQFESAFEEGTVVAYSGTSLTLAVLPSFQSIANHNTDNFYRNMTVLIYEGNGIGESRRIISYDYTDASPDTHIVTLESAFSGSVNSSSKYKIYKWAGDNSTFGNDSGGTATKKDYIDKSGSTFPYNDIEAYSENYLSTYFLRTKTVVGSDNQSEDLGFVTYNPANITWAAGDVLASNSTAIGNNTLDSGVTYTLSFWCRAQTKWYNYVSDVGHGERVPFVQIYSDSVTDGTNTGLYLFQSNDGPVFMSGSETDYQYAQNITKQYVNNGDFEVRGSETATGGVGGYSHKAGTHTYCPPTDWYAYDGYSHSTNHTITYSFEQGSDAWGDEGNTLNMNPGSSFAWDASTDGQKPNCYLYQDLTLEDNQWYDLSFMYSTDSGAAFFSIVDTFDLTNTGIVSNDTDGTGSQEDAADGSVTLTVDTTTATDTLVKNREIYKSDGTFLGICTTVNSGTEIVFGGGLENNIPNDTTLYTAKYIKPWTTYAHSSTSGLTTYQYGGDNIKSFGGQRYSPYKFFVPSNSGTPKVIRIAFAPLYHNQNLRLDCISVKKSFPDLVSMGIKSNPIGIGSNPSNIKNPYSSDIESWVNYKMVFKIPNNYDNATDWVINLNAGSWGYQNGATYNSASLDDNQIVWFDGIRLEGAVEDSIILLNDNTSSESKINIYSEAQNSWLDNNDLTWSGLKMKPVYNYINGLLKISDANFQSGNQSKIFYYYNSKYNVRDFPLSTAPQLDISAGGNGVEIDSTYNALNYINEHSYLGGHQHYLVGDTETLTNWPLDDLDGEKEGLGRIIRYYSVDDVDSEKGALYVTGGAELTDDDSSWTSDSSSKANPSYFTWCGQHGGSGNPIDAEDMHSELSSYSTGSVSRITFEFTYEFWGANGGDGYRIGQVYPPKFIITAGKRASDTTDIFGSGATVTAQHIIDFSLGKVEVTGVDNESQAVLYVDEIGGKEYDLSLEIQEGIEWEHSQQWLYSTVINAEGAPDTSRTSSKTFCGQIDFEDGDVEITDDIIFKVDIQYPPRPQNNYDLIDALSRSHTGGSGYNYPRWEKIKFANILTHVRTTNWTALADGFTPADSNKTKVNFSFGTPTGATAFGWGERLFETGVSSVNIFDEESNIQPNSTIIGITTSDNLETSTSSIVSGQSPDLSVYVGHDVFNDEYRRKLKYYMKDTESNIWYLQFYIDLEKNTIYSTTSNFKAIGLNSTTNNCYEYFIPKEKMLNYNEVDSYESQTLVSQELTLNELVCDYKSSVVVNNRLYVGNIRQDGVIYPDRMIKSPIGKYNILPKNNFIDVAINDGDEITALEYYKDKLLQFKRRKVFVINTSGDYEFLEDTFDNVGVLAPYQVTKTPYGIAWANGSGCFLYDGNKLTNLIENIIPNHEKDALISYNFWTIDDDEDNLLGRALVGYNPISKDIIITRNLSEDSSSTFPDGFVYNMDSKSWYMTHRAFTGIFENQGNPLYSNFTTNKNGECIVYSKKSSGGSNTGFNTIMKWQHTEGNDEAICAQKGITGSQVNNRLFNFTSSDFTFGNITARKKIYKVYITYKSVDSDGDSMNSGIKVRYSTNGSSTKNTFSDDSTNYAAATGLVGSEEWATAILKPSSSINNIYSFQLIFEEISISDSSAVGFQINDISIVYREKRVK